MKVSIIGLGMVGKEVMHYLLHFSSVKEIVVVDLNKEKAQGEIYDFLDTFPLGFVKHRIKIQLGDYQDMEGSDFVVVCSSIPPNAGKVVDRDELAKENAIMVKKIAVEIDKYAKDSMIIITSNPLDSIVYGFNCHLKNIPSHKILGTGTLLETIRLKHYLSEFYGVASGELDVLVLGEHGVKCFIAWSLFTVCGVAYKEYEKLNNTKKIDEQIAIKYVVDRAQNIMKARNYTDHGVGACACFLINSIWNDSNEVLPVATLIEDGSYGLDKVVLSTPNLINKKGREKIVQINLTEEEKVAFKEAADKVKTIHDICK